jgi:hypothetical protein
MSTGPRTEHADVVVTAGNPTPEETAAVVVALDTVRRADRAARARRPLAPAWQRAAHIEGVGGGAVASPSVLHGH